MPFTTLMLTAALSIAPQLPTASNAPASDVRPATLLAGIQGVHFPISTRRDEAQKFFDQGLALVYASNQDEALRSFRRAAEIDPSSPMPHWGIALAFGQTLGQPVDASRAKARLGWTPRTAGAEDMARGFLGRIRPQVLNVAGPRESSDPGIGACARALLLRVLEDA